MTCINLFLLSIVGLFGRIVNFSVLLSTEISYTSTVLTTGMFFLLVGSMAGLAFYVRKYRTSKKHNTLLVQANQQLLFKIKKIQEANQQLKSSEEKLKNTNTTKDRFFSIIAHDLKGPLNSLTGLLQLLIKYADSFSKEELKDFGKNMNKSVNNLIDLLENLMHWSQTQSGMIDYCPEEVNLHELVTQTVDLLAPAADNKNILITTDVPEGIAVFADKNMISFTLRNLVTNAIKFTRDGGKITIGSSLDNNVAEIAVSDTGIGMRAEEIEKLFRIDKCYTTNGTANEIGTGLGLILCSEFIQKNKGKIRVESILDKGSTFRFYLPALASSEQVPLADVH